MLNNSVHIRDKKAPTGGLRPLRSMCNSNTLTDPGFSRVLINLKVCLVSDKQITKARSLKTRASEVQRASCHHLIHIRDLLLLLRR